MNAAGTATIGSLVTAIAALFRRSGLSQAQRDAELLVRSVLGVERAFVVAHADHPVSTGHQERIAELAGRRARGEPLQYVLGRWPFWKDEFALTRDVLIPRPETELLVEIGARLMQAQPQPGSTCGPTIRHRPWVLDLAAGSGCVGLSLLRELPQAALVATDISMAALRVASENALHLGLADRFMAAAGDGLSMLGGPGRRCFDLIVSNPPYIAEQDWDKLPTEVREWEPRRALAGGPDGLSFYRRWILPALDLLAPEGHILMEFGFGQWPVLEQIIKQTGCPCTMIPDLAGIPRVFDLALA